MKTRLLLLFFCLSAVNILAADYVYCDFETKDLNFATNNSITYEVVANPVSGGINTSAHCGKVISAGGKWELIYSASMEEFIDFNESKIFKMKVYSPRSGVPVYFKVEGGAPAKEVTTVTTTKVNEWEELIFDFTSLDPQSMVYNKFVLLFDAGNEGSGETFYFDDIIGPDAATVTIPETNFITYSDFEDITLNFTQQNTENDMQYEVVANPDKSGINTSDYCGKLVTTSDNYELLASDVMDTPFDFAQYGFKFKMKVYAPTVGNVYFKVQNTEGSSNKEAQLYCPVANQWYEMEFDFADLLPASGVMTKIILLFDANSPVEGDTWYFDDIQGPGEDATAIQHIEVNQALTYPNPVDNRINFYETQENALVSITSLNGKVVFKERFTGNSLSVSELNLDNGIYFIRINEQTASFIKK
ncbi:T9SS type A sorting domain-containing protein [Saccharicrinis sp. FJH62]|uniref:T9SS type A sorting domain-containing protein n=1 Tax=Saccharicrinis sp. FJH62 TaxID=3344657 RepID=UPI0035D40277